MAETATTHPFYTTDFALLAKHARNAAAFYRTQMDPAADTLVVYNERSIATMAIERLEMMADAITEAFG